MRFSADEVYDTLLVRRLQMIYIIISFIFPYVYYTDSILITVVQIRK